MQGANGSDDGGGEWERIGKKGKKEGIQASNKKGKKNSMKNARTLSLQAFYTEHGLPDDSVLEQAEADQMAIGIGRLVRFFGRGGSSDNGPFSIASFVYVIL